MYNIKYLTVHKVHTHADTIRKFLYGCVLVREIIHSLKLVDYLQVHTHKPYNNLHLTLCLQVWSADNLQEQGYFGSKIKSSSQIIENSLYPIEGAFLSKLNKTFLERYVN